MDSLWSQLGSPTSAGASTQTDITAQGQTATSMERAQSLPKPRGAAPGKRGRGRASHANPSASTLAQRRYHERQKVWDLIL